MAEASSEFDVFATLGTFDAPFARMDELAALLARNGRRVLYQYGMASPKPAENLTAVQWLPFDEMTRRLRETPVVVAHSGVGILMSSLRQGRRPVVVPRRAAFGEHVDDHQLQIARKLAERGLVVALLDEVEPAAMCARILALDPAELSVPALRREDKPIFDALRRFFGDEAQGNEP